MLYKPSNNFAHQTLTLLQTLSKQFNVTVNQILRLCLDSCLVCHRGVQTKNGLCCECKMDLPWIKQSCYQCGIPLITDHTMICGQCQKSSFSYQHTLALFRYEQPIDHIIQALKFHGKLYYAHLLGLLLTEKILQAIDQHHYLKPDLLIAVPLHPKRLRERGFNQAFEIAKLLSRRLQIPLANREIVRQRHTQAQSMMPADERKKNMMNAFTINSNIVNGKSLAIIDDVMTTGTTVQELAKTLVNAGAKKIDIWCCARTCQSL